MARRNSIEPVENAIGLEEFIGVHKWMWRLQYVFVVVVVLAAALTLAGLFGEGWLSRSEASRGAATVKFEQFTRFGKETVVEVEGDGDGMAVKLPTSYLERFKLETVVPRPYEETLEGDNVILRFEGIGPGPVRLHLLPQKPGSSSADILVNGNALTLSQYTYP